MKRACKTLHICFLAILILALAQTLALLAGEASVKSGLPGVFEPVIDAVLYPVLAFFGLKLIAGRKRHFSLRSFRIGRLKLEWYWGLTVVLLPSSVVFAFVLTGGRVESSIIAIAGYAIVSVIAFVLGRKCGEDRRRSC